MDFLVINFYPAVKHISTLFLMSFFITGCIVKQPVDTKRIPTNKEIQGIIIPVGIFDSDHADSLRFNLSRIINSVKEANYNAIFLQIRYRGENIYPSDIENQSIDLNNSTALFDPVEWAINEAHQRGLKIFGVFDLLTIWEGPTLPENMDHLYYTHGSEAAPENSWALKGETGYFLNPKLPEVKTVLKSMIRHFVMFYDIDGLMLDFRSPLTTDNLKLKSSPSARKWDPLTDLVEDVVVEALLMKPYLVNSAALYARNLAVYPELFQWLEAGIIDLLIPVFNNMKEANLNHDRNVWGNLVVKTDSSSRIIPGILSDGGKKDIQHEADRFQSCGAPGYVLFPSGLISDADLNKVLYSHTQEKKPFPEFLKGIDAEQVYGFNISELLPEIKAGQLLEIKRFKIIKQTDSQGRAGMILPEKPDTITINTAGSSVQLPTFFWKTPYNYVVTQGKDVRRPAPWLEFRQMPDRISENKEHFLLCKTSYPAVAWINYDTVNVYKTGIFFNKIILSEGINRVRAGILNEDSSSTTYVREFTYRKTNNGRKTFPLWIDKNSVKPNMEMTLTPDDRFYISFMGSKGQTGIVKILPGKKEKICTRTDFDDYSLYEAYISLGQLNNSRNYIVKIALHTNKESGPGKTYEIETENRISMEDPDNLPYVRIIKDHSRLTYNLGQVRLGGPIRAEYPRGIILKTSGVLGNYYRINLNKVEEGYIDKNNVEVMSQTYTRHPYYITSLYCAPSDSADILTIPYPQPIPYAVYPEPDQHRIRIRLYGAKTSSTWITHRQGRKYIEKVTWGQPTPDTYEINVNLTTSRIWGYDLRKEGNLLVFRLKYPPPYNLVGNKPLAGIKIAIEAGHGGDSYGAMGLSGLFEKEINLDLAHKLGTLLGSYGAEIFQMREIDTTMSLLTKRDKAISSNADILISIHANAAGTDRGYLRVGGTSTYYHNPFWAELAEKIYTRLLELDINEFGVIGSFNYTVIRLSQMPSILVEQAFMTHAEDEEKLASEEFRQEMAEKIYKGIIDYLANKKNEHP